MTTPKRNEALLAAGMLAGLALAAAGLLGPGLGADVAASRDVAALVGDRAISLGTYAEALALVARDRREPLDDDARRRVLDRLIDEELLVQRALALGLAESDRRVRADLVGAVVDSVVAHSEAEPIDDAELEAFFAGNRALFEILAPARVGRVFVAATRADAEARAGDAARRLKAKEPFESVRRELGDVEPVAIPSSPLPPRKLRDYVGSTAAEAVAHLAGGQVSDPIRESAGWSVFVVFARDREGAGLGAVREDVEAELRRRRGDEALRRYLAELRRDVEVSFPRGRDGALAAAAELAPRPSSETQR